MRAPAGAGVDRQWAAERHGVWLPAPHADADHEAPADTKEETVGLAALLEEVGRIRGWIHDVARDTQLMRRLHADTTYHSNQHLQQQLDAAATRGLATGLKICGALRQLEARASALAAGPAAAAGGALARVARLQFAASRRLYADALRDHHAALDALRDDQLKLLKRQIQLTQLTVTEEETERLLDTENIALFVDNVRLETAAARSALREAEARHAELARVERALTDVRDLFAQLAHLVVAQQEQIDTVEWYALQAGALVERGGDQLLKGSVSRRSAGQKKISLIICLVSGFVIVLLVLILT